MSSLTAWCIIERQSIMFDRIIALTIGRAIMDALAHIIVQNTTQHGTTFGRTLPMRVIGTIIRRPTFTADITVNNPFGTFILTLSG